MCPWDQRQFFSLILTDSFPVASSIPALKLLSAAALSLRSPVRCTQRRQGGSRDGKKKLRNKYMNKKATNHITNHLRIAIHKSLYRSKKWLYPFIVITNRLKHKATKKLCFWFVPNLECFYFIFIFPEMTRKRKWRIYFRRYGLALVICCMCINRCLSWNTTFRNIFVLKK